MKYRSSIWFWLCTFLLAVFYFPIFSAAAQAPTPSDDQVNAIAKQLYCPICQNVPLDVCPTDACKNWRELIRLMLAQGKTPDEIKRYFVDHYGARVLAEPPAAGYGWLVYAVPPVVFILGIFLLFRAFRTWKKASTRSPTLTGYDEARSSPSDEYQKRLEDELRKRS